MENFQNNQFSETEERLKSARPQISENIEHEQRLRRALLNSDYFHSSKIVRFFKIFWPEYILTFPLVSLSLFGGIFLAVLTQFVLFNASVSNNNSLEFSKNAQLVFEELHKEGKIRYAGEDEKGTPIFYLTVSENNVIEVRDQSHYIYNLVSFDK